LSLSFEILPFDYWSPELKWNYAKYSNEEEGEEMFRTIDDLEEVAPDLFWYYGIVFSDGSWSVTEDYLEALEEAFDHLLEKIEEDH
jgi:hypothetical protein